MGHVPKWKRFETRVAKAVGGRRIPVTGVDRADRDVEDALFCYQAKYRKTLPAWLFDWLDGIAATGQCHDKVGVLVLNRPGADTGDAAVLVKFRDWCDLHGTPPPSRVPDADER